MPFVLDASIALCRAFEDESEVAAETALNLLAIDEAAAPELWWFEVRNALIMSERRGRKSVTQSRSFLTWLRRLPVRIDHSPDESSLLTLARQHRLTIYDAAYLELARRRGEPLATLDRTLAAAAQAESVALIGAP